MVTYKDLLFLRTPRTASTAITQVLLENGGKQVAGIHDTIDRFVTNKRYRVFTVIRNPLDVLVTWYVREGRWTTIEDFIENYQSPIMVQNGRLFYHVDHCSYIFDYARLDQVGAFLNLKIPVVNVTEEKLPFEEYMTPKIVEIARNRFREDFRIYERFRSVKNSTTPEW